MSCMRLPLRLQQSTIFRLSPDASLFPVLLCTPARPLSFPAAQPPPPSPPPPASRPPSTCAVPQVSQHHRASLPPRPQPVSAVAAPKAAAQNSTSSAAEPASSARAVASGSSFKMGSPQWEAAVKESIEDSVRPSVATALMLGWRTHSSQASALAMRRKCGLSAFPTG